MEVCFYSKRRSLFLNFLITCVFLMCSTQESYCSSFFKRFFLSNVKEEKSELQKEISIENEDDEDENNKNENQEEIIDTLNFLNSKVKTVIHDSHSKTKLDSQYLQVSILESLDQFRSKMAKNNVLNEDTISNWQELYDSIMDNFNNFRSKIDETNEITANDISRINMLYSDVVKNTSVMYKTANTLNKQSKIYSQESIALYEKTIRSIRYAEVATFTVISVAVGAYFYLEHQRNAINNAINEARYQIDLFFNLFNRLLTLRQVNLANQEVRLLALRQR